MNSELKSASQAQTKRVNELEHKYWELAEAKKRQEKDMTQSIQTIQNALLSKQREMEDFQLNHLGDNNLEFEKVKIQNKLELAYAKEMEARDSQIEDLRSKLEYSERENKVLISKVNNSFGDQRNTIESLKGSHQNQIESLMKEIADLQERISFNLQDEEIRELRLSKETLETRNKLLERQNDELSDDIARVAAEKNSNIMEKIRSEERLREEINGLLVEKDRLEVQNEHLRKENSDVYVNIKKVEKNYFEQLAQKKDLENALEQKQKDLDDLEEKNISMSNRMGKEMMEREEEAKRKVQSLSSKIVDLEVELQSLKKDKNSKQSLNSQKYEALAQELSEGQRAATNQRQRIRELEDQVESFSEQLRSQKSIIQKTLNDKDRVLEDYKSMETKFNIISAENKELTEFVSKKKLEAVKNEEEKTEKKPANQNQNQNELVKEYIQKIQTLQNANSKLKKAVNILNKKLVDSVAKNMFNLANQNNLTKSHQVINRTSNSTFNPRYYSQQE